MAKLIFAYLFSTFAMIPSVSIAQSLPDDFVYLRDIAPDIKQKMRYSTKDNFMGQVLDGYGANECILKKEAALALEKVQNELRTQGLSLIVFDCYRPQKAVDHMVRWVNGGDETNAKYFAVIPRSQLIEKGYISDKSNHSRGYTIDLAITWNFWLFRPAHKYIACKTRNESYTLDFGVPFDCFDKAANTNDSRLSKFQKTNRKLLLDVMNKNGFRNYDLEFWHYTHNSQPENAPRFDFDISHMPNKN